MKFTNSKKHHFEIDGRLSLDRLAGLGIQIKLGDSCKVPKKWLVPVDEPGSGEFWMRPHWEEALLESAKLPLPTPRLQLTWVDESGDWAVRSCLYALVIPLGKLDIRAEGEDGKHGVHKQHFALIGCTRSSGGPHRPVRNGEVDTPFRDHSHALWDSEALGGTPIFAVCGPDFREIKPKADQ